MIDSTGLPIALRAHLIMMCLVHQQWTGCSRHSLMVQDRSELRRILSLVKSETGFGFAWMVQRLAAAVLRKTCKQKHVS